MISFICIENNVNPSFGTLLYKRGVMRSGTRYNSVTFIQREYINFFGPVGKLYEEICEYVQFYYKVHRHISILADISNVRESIYCRLLCYTYNIICYIHT